LAQESGLGAERQPPAQLELKKTAKTRPYQGKSVQGEERTILAGETLWGILVQEKGLAERRFGQYQAIIESLNPGLKEPNILRAGETVFIPFRLDELLGIERSPQGEVRLYRVKPGDFVYKILRREFALESNDQIQAAFEKLKELNPSKKNWNLLIVGEAIRFPGPVGSQPSVVTTEARHEPDQSASAPAQGPRELAEARWALLQQLATALGNKFVRDGEEVFNLQDGQVTLERNKFPVFNNPQLGRRVIVDSGDVIPAGLRARIEAETGDTSVLSLKKETGPVEFTNQVLTQLGYQALPGNRPLVLHDMGVGIQLKGDWMVMQPETAGRREQIWVFLLTSTPEKMPDLLGDYLGSKGVKVTQILTPAFADSPSAAPPLSSLLSVKETEKLPQERTALIDTLMQSCQITFVRDQEISIPLREGINVKIKIDRYWESGGKQSGFIFGRLSPDMKKALENGAGLKLGEIDINGPSTRDVVALVLQGLGEPATYVENRFTGAESGRLKESLVLTVRGFLLRNRSLLVTDRAIPRDVERFLLNQGIKIAYFQ
jgi:hypothetical protein